MLERQKEGLGIVNIKYYRGSPDEPTSELQHDRGNGGVTINSKNIYGSQTWQPTPMSQHLGGEGGTIRTSANFAYKVGARQTWNTKIPFKNPRRVSAAE